MISYIRTPMGRQNLSGSDFESANWEMLNFLELDVALVTSVHRTSWAGVHGTKYIPNECILLVKSENETPVFGTLRVIWLVNLQVVVFQVSVLETVNFNVHLNAYRVQEPAQETGLDLVLHDHLLSHEVMHMFNYDGDQYISPKIFLGDLLK